MRELDFNENMFDGILLAYSLIHVPKKDVIRTLGKLYGFLKPNCPMLVVVQVGESQEVFLTEPFKSDEKMFVNIFSPQEIKDVLKKTGFSVISEHQRKPREGEFDFIKYFVLTRKHI